ncbi:MAG: UDP-N-acetylmuramoyl-L-alanine--D-glutamate ligase [Chlorobi bacterium]|nr:UDP-N-acetylmuramoyl-L-alanine--D-glutamate ligase [Chlorobiota bacterium]
MRCTVIGAGKSGIAAAQLAQALGYKVFVTESAPAERYPALEYLRQSGIEFECGGHTLERALEADLIVSSPGIPPSAPILHAARNANIELIGELEFSSRFAHAPIIAITGTNGKTTTTALTAHILRSGGYDAIACGNNGLPLSQVIAEDLANRPSRRVYVVEASSYQLSQTVQFHPVVAAILNITPDHLAYHGSMDNYVQAKWKIFQNQTPNDVLILCADDPRAAEASHYAQSRIEWFGLHPVAAGMYANTTESSIVLVSSNTEVKLMRYTDLPVRGIHNVYNSMAAALAARAMEVTNENIRDSLLSFTGVEHRLEHVRFVGGIEYINDSKATNVNATWYALQAFEQPIVLLLGGQADNNDYSVLDDLVRQQCRCIVCFGQEAQHIFDHFCTSVRCYRTDTLEEAVTIAHSVAYPGDIVLLSPACKSFDEFINFEHRGSVFKEAVYRLPG